MSMYRTVSVVISRRWPVVQSYADPEEASYAGKHYGISVVYDEQSGSLTLTGPEDKVELFVDDFTMGDKRSINTIMNRAKEVNEVVKLSASQLRSLIKEIVVKEAVKSRPAKRSHRR